MTRAAIVLALVAALSFAARSFLTEGTNITGSGAALAFGFLLLAALQTGHIFHALRLPHLTGFILCGALFGPEVLGLLTHAMIKDLTIVKNVAVALIALTAGCELNFRKLAPKIKAIGLVSFFGMAFAGASIWGFFYLMSPRLEFMAEMTPPQRAVICLVCANVLIALSPSVAMGILSETRAEGQFSELSLSIVVLADLVVAISFSFSESFTRKFFPVEGVAHSMIGALAVHILGSMVVGIVVGGILAVYIRKVAIRVGLFVFAVCFVVAEAGAALHVDPLLMGLTAGLFLENVSPVSGHEVIHQTEIAATPTFAIFFAVIGAGVHVHEFMTVAPFAIGGALARAFGMFVGARTGTTLARVEPALARRVPFAMFSQAGIAIALSNLVKESFKPWGEGAATLLLGTVLVNEMIGPILFRAAVMGSGEAGKKRDVGAHGRPSHASIPPEMRPPSIRAPKPAS
jgi:Kef-type K+ transport system membrane component KefB